MKGSVEYAFVARELIVRTGRHLVVLMLPLVCWLAAQECPTQALLAWAVQHGTALLATLRSVALQERISTSLPLRKTRLMKSIAFRPDTGSMRW
jgi:hypothetical protein